LIYNVHSINRMLQYRVWATRFWTRFVSSWSHQFEAFKIQQNPQIISWDYGKRCLNYQFDQLQLGLLSFIFGSETFPLVFSQTISQVLHLIVFSSPCSFERYIICGFSSHGTIGSIFELWAVEKLGGTVATGKISNSAPLHFDF
jgi:hypothetical protein